MKASKIILIFGIFIILSAIVTAFIIHQNNPIHKAHALETEGKYPEAVACLKEVVEKNPNSANAWRELGNIYNIMNKPEWALQCFGQYVKLRPNDETMVAWVKKYRKSMEPKYSRATVQILSATISPARMNGKTWNAGGIIQPILLSGIYMALGVPAPFARVAGQITSIALKPNEMPAPYGVVEIAIDGQFRPELNLKIGGGNIHTLTPLFQGLTYNNIPLNDGTRIRINLYNYRVIHRHHIFIRHRHHLFRLNNVHQNNPVVQNTAISNLDLIGIAEINSNDIENALESQKIYQVKVADQTQNQLLFIGIEARP